MNTFMEKNFMRLFVVAAVIVGITATGIIVSATQTQTIEEMIAGKSATEKATVKGQEIAKIKTIAKQKFQYSGGDYFIEVVDMKAIPKGVEIYARAWNSDGTQIGFGKDGSVDVERFVFINPPVLVDDPNGTITRQWNDRITGELQERKLREDPKEAILQSLVHIISVKQQKFGSDNIVVGKVGNTTLTAYPNAGTGTAPIDGQTEKAYGAGSGVAFSTLRAAAGGSVDNTGAAADTLLGADTGANNYRLLYRGGFGFDTSLIGTGQVDSATISFYGRAAGMQTYLGDTNANIVDFNPANGSNFVGSDHGNYGTTLYSDTEIAISAATTTAYNNFPLNAAGKAEVNGSGNSYFGRRLKWDVDDNFTGTWVSDVNTNWQSWAADQSGTSQDPKLVVEYSARPVISNIQESNITETSATITWDTDVSSDSKVSYGVSSGNYTNNTSDATDVTSHNISLSGLTQATTYYYVVVSTDTANIAATSTEGTFNTLAPSTFLAYKSLNQSLATTTDIVLNEDDDLVLTLGTSTTYAISGTIFATSTHTLPDIKIGFATSSAGVTMDIGYLASDGTGGWIQYGNVASSKIDVPSSGAAVIQINGTVKTTNASTVLRLHWAQNTANSNEITVKSGSYIRSEQIQ